MNSNDDALCKGRGLSHDCCIPFPFRFCTIFTIGGFTMGNYVEEGHDDWIYMYNTNFMTVLNCCQQILPLMKGGGVSVRHTCLL